MANFESEATGIATIEVSVVPGLLQTPAYTRAVLRCLGISEPELERYVAVRAGRQTVLGKARPPYFHALIDEAALRRQLGAPMIMIEQIRQILNMAGRSNITVQMIPFDRGGHQGMISSFTVINFPKAPAVVFLEHLHSSVFLDQAPDTEPFQRAIQSLIPIALGPADSAELMATIAADYERK
jgi:hypothetical protein